MPDNLTVHYYKDDREIVIDKLSRSTDVTSSHAAGLMLLMASAYGREFEEPKGKIPKGAFERHFDPEDNQRLTQVMERMVTHIDDRESQYWLLLDNDPAVVALQGLIKVSPSRGTFWQKRKLTSPNCYINDIVVRTPGRGDGTALAYTSLTYEGFNGKRAIVLDAFRENVKANSWFERQLRLVPTDEPVGPLRMAGHDFEQLRYSTPETVTLDHVREHLRRSHPWLDSATTWRA